MNQKLKNILWIVITVVGAVCGYFSGIVIIDLSTEVRTMDIIRAKVLIPIAFACIFGMSSINLLKK